MLLVLKHNYLIVKQLIINIIFKLGENTIYTIENHLIIIF